MNYMGHKKQLAQNLILSGCDDFFPGRQMGEKLFDLRTSQLG